MSEENQEVTSHLNAIATELTNIGEVADQLERMAMAVNELTSVVNGFSVIVSERMASGVDLARIADALEGMVDGD